MQHRLQFTGYLLRDFIDLFIGNFPTHYGKGRRKWCARDGARSTEPSRVVLSEARIRTNTLRFNFLRVRRTCSLILRGEIIVGLITLRSPVYSSRGYWQRLLCVVDRIRLLLRRRSLQRLMHILVNKHVHNQMGVSILIRVIVRDQLVELLNVFNVSPSLVFVLSVLVVQALLFDINISTRLS